jgi:hypothetical protein
MKTEAEIREQRQILQEIANADGEMTFDKSQAQNLVHTLTWVLGEDIRTSPPSDLLGWVGARFTPQSFEVIRFDKPDKR